MTFRFGRFELEEATRELRLGTQPVELQPRMFDLLVYLVRNRDRVVPKAELLDAIWPGVIVTDSSIMRAVSLIRTVLREGGLTEAIQTLSRQGYRFVAALEPEARAAPDAAIERARAACDRKQWQQALDVYREACASGEPLRPGDFEQWANAALSVGQPNEAIGPLEQAVAAYSQNADRLGAARAALTLTNVNLEGRALSVAKGWHRRAGVFLRDETRETREHGLHLWLSARIGLFEGDLPTALAYAKQAEALARRLEDPDLEALGLIYRAHVELATSDIRAGLVHLDEAGAATLAGAVSPWVASIVFCSVIWVYLDRGDLQRAAQWTDQFTRWVERNAGFGAPGLCRLHRGEVLCLQGDLQNAESEIHRARELLAKTTRYAEGDACRVLGEIRLLRGEFDAAEDAFRQAHELGWHPIPGWALLWAERGRSEAAIKALQRALEAPNWADGQRRGILLGHLSRIAARSGDRALAHRSLEDLERSTALRETAGCEAGYQQARAEVAYAGGAANQAITALRQAVAIWLDAGSRINAAHGRLRLAEILRETGDAEEAAIEAASARKAFADMQAQAMVDRCRLLVEGRA